jgi:hypothetical protein
MTTFDDYHFLREGGVEIDAAIVGIGKSRWEHLDEAEATPRRALELMKGGHFDVIPIHHAGGRVREYFHTLQWGDFSAAHRSQITHRDVMPLQTPIREVIRAFAQPAAGGQRFFYFLATEGRIAGLVSVANLNCRQVQVYLFSLLCELEDRLGNFIKAMGVPSSEIIRAMREDQLRRYRNDLRAGLEEDPLEYLYLLDLFRLIRAKKLFGGLGFTGDEDFRRLEKINELRKGVAHPVKSLVTRSNPVEILWERIELIEEALFRLRDHDQP